MTTARDSARPATAAIPFPRGNDRHNEEVEPDEDPEWNVSLKVPEDVGGAGPDRGGREQDLYGVTHIEPIADDFGWHVDGNLGSLVEQHPHLGSPGLVRLTNHGDLTGFELNGTGQERGRPRWAVRRRPQQDQSDEGGEGQGEDNGCLPDGNAPSRPPVQRHILVAVH